MFPLSVFAFVRPEEEFGVNVGDCFTQNVAHAFAVFPSPVRRVLALHSLSSKDYGTLAGLTGTSPRIAGDALLMTS